jgi:hypothetical protein
MFIAAPIAAALNCQRSHFVESAEAGRRLGFVPTAATLWVENWDSLEEHRCFADLIGFLVERGAQVRSHE